MTARILLIDADEAVRGGYATALRTAGFAAVEARRGFDGLESLYGDPSIGLVVLDMAVDDVDGFDLIRMIRRISTVPVILTTARADEDRKVRGLDLGADDYLVKPIGPRELVARINAMLRRNNGNVSPASRYQIGELVVDLASRTVLLAGDRLELSRKEFDLLALLARESPRVVTREQIVHEVWDPLWYGPTKTLDVHVSWIRRKLGDQTDAPRYIRTVRGVGFRLVAPDG